ncbi:hypothetical protein C725_1742 [Pacificimonas flava]|uniref:Uncharacterized protein n=1 Tax=Pacificimonas flava TaxID=1234595 RepID=M2U3U2_9SPHN|nr:hypothetical protein C725_1742 [Pacificimonas flava]
MDLLRGSRRSGHECACGNSCEKRNTGAIWPRHNRHPPQDYVRRHAALSSLRSAIHAER